MIREERQAALAARVVLEALDWLGTPYRHQASQKGQGTDCLGLVRGVYRALHDLEPETPPTYGRRPAPGQELLLEAAERCLVPAQEVGPGTVLLFRMRRSLAVSHCGITISLHRFVHAYDGQRVVSSELSPFWQSRIAGRFHFPESS